MSVCDPPSGPYTSFQYEQARRLSTLVRMDEDNFSIGVAELVCCVHDHIAADANSVYTIALLVRSLRAFSPLGDWYTLVVAVAILLHRTRARPRHTRQLSLQIAAAYSLLAKMYTDWRPSLPRLEALLRRYTCRDICNAELMLLDAVGYTLVISPEEFDRFIRLLS